MRTKRFWKMVVILASILSLCILFGACGSKATQEQANDSNTKGVEGEHEGDYSAIAGEWYYMDRGTPYEFTIYSDGTWENADGNKGYIDDRGYYALMDDEGNEWYDLYYDSYSDSDLTCDLMIFDTETYVRGYDSAQAYYEKIYAEDLSLTEYEAQEMKGFFVKDGDKYYPLPALEELQSTHYQIGAAVYLLEDTDSNVPEITGEREVVLFADSTSEIRGYSVLKQGFTIPACIELDAQRQYYSIRYSERERDPRWPNVNDGFRPELMNGMSFQDYCSSKCVRASEYAEHVGNYNDVIVLDLEKDEEITAEYHLGTEYRQAEIYADASYYVIDGAYSDFGDPKGIVLESVLGTTPYAVVNTDSLSPGMNIIRKDRKAYLLNVKE